MQIRPDRAPVVAFLLKHGASPNPRYVQGNSALHYAAALGGKPDVIEELLDAGAVVDFSNDEQATPLFTACQVFYLLKSQAALHLASHYQWKRLVYVYGE